MTVTAVRPHRVDTPPAILTAICHALVNVFVAQLSSESSSGTVARKAPCANSAVRTAAKTLRCLAVFVVVAAQKNISARTGADVVADGATLARTAPTRVDG